MAKTKNPTPPRRRATKEVDRYKRFMIGAQLAPVFAAAFFRGVPAANGTGGDWNDYEDLAESLVKMADAIARRLDKA